MLSLNPYCHCVKINRKIENIDYILFMIFLCELLCGHVIIY